MPRGDGTGPRGLGSMTGRAAGFCAGFEKPGYANAAPGRGIRAGLGCGGGRGWRHWFYATGLPGVMRFGAAMLQNPDAEKQALKSRADALQSELDLLKKRMSEIETETASKE